MRVVGPAVLALGALAGGRSHSYPALLGSPSSEVLGRAQDTPCACLTPVAAVKRRGDETANRSPHRGLARIGKRRHDGSSCIRLHWPSLHDLHLHVLHIELSNSEVLLRSSHLRSVEVAQQDVPS
jgi:hypothetical protein